MLYLVPSGLARQHAVQSNHAELRATDSLPYQLFVRLAVRGAG